MSLRFAILTALTERESTGLELSRRFDRSIGYFWPASHQQIYRELDRLAADGLVTQVADEPDQQRPGRGQPKRYAISPDGVAALREWVGELDEPTKRREALFVRLRASASLGETGAVRGAIEHHLARHRANLVTYRQIEARDFDPPADKRAALQHLVLQAGIELELAHVRWCEHALEELDRWDDADDA